MNVAPEEIREEQPRGGDELWQWFQGALGQSVLHLENSYLSRLLPDLFGYHILQLGELRDAHLLDSSRIHHKIIASSRFLDAGSGIHLVCDQHSLPINPDSMDIMVLPHVLEFDVNPHQVLRETERVLIGEGNVVIIGFNPWSLWGVWRLFRAWRDQKPWNGKYISLSRIRDWLKLLDFEIITTEYFYYRPPLENSRIMKKLDFMEPLGRYCWRYFGGVYLLAAKKRVISMTPIKMQWQARRHKIVTSMVEPSTRNIQACNGR
jgi:Methylase involved in ubiquinone/menaquinone biosynthesis